METPTGADFVDVDDIFHLEEAVGSGTFGTVIRARVRTPCRRRRQFFFTSSLEENIFIRRKQYTQGN
jgi:hypothetical protein